MQVFRAMVLKTLVQFAAGKRIPVIRFRYGSNAGSGSSGAGAQSVSPAVGVSPNVTVCLFCLLSNHLLIPLNVYFFNLLFKSKFIK